MTGESGSNASCRNNPLDVVQKVLGDLTNCSIGNISVNIAPTFITQTHIDSGSDSLVSNNELNIP